MLTGTKQIFIVAASAAAAMAHLEPGSLSSPKAGQSYAAGSKVNITWVQAEYHRGNYTLAWSKNGGTSWESIATWAGPTGDGVTVNYGWTVPGAPGATTKVRLCQLGQCGDADYELVSGNFTITPAASVSPEAGAAGPRLRLDGDRNLEVSFDLASAGRVALKAYAADGTLAAVLLDGEHAAGPHAYSLASQRLRAGEALVLRLESGGRTLATLRSSP